jgi:hypothetical protein
MTVPEQPASKRLMFLKWLGTLVGLALFGWLLAGQDWQRILQTIQSAPLWVFPAAFAFFVSGLICNAWRWHVLLRVQEVPIPFGETVRLVFAGTFASNFLPSTIGGDVVRAAGVTRFTSSVVLSIGSIVLDRILNVLSMLLLLPFPWSVFGTALLPTSEHTRAGAASALLLALRRSLPDWLNAAINTQAQKIRNVLHIWWQHPRTLIHGLLISWLSVLVIFVAIWLLAHGLGFAIAFYEVVAVAVVSYIVTLLPISVNGYGVQEVLFVTLFTHLGATPEQATVVTLLIRVLMLLETLPGALWLPGLLAREHPPAT